ncbi:MAG: Ldh family oxidoreductase [Gammaproteobacteria bacterium]|nr:Ldh family oxidoreductase [Gammaproteobacteria bacterium]
MVRIQSEPLARMISATFQQAGAAKTEADAISNNLVSASLCGHDSHGVVRVPRYLAHQAEGFMHFGKQVTTLVESDSLVVLDGQYGFGQIVGKQATDIGINKAQQRGVALVALRHAGHLGRIGEWAERACDAGIVSVHFVNVARSMLVAPFGGRERRMSTAPVTIGVVNPMGDNFILDFATSRIAEGKALVALKGGGELKPDTLVSADGSLSNDPFALYGDVAPGAVPDPRQGPGALVAMGEHKGSGLAMACELLAGALTGSGVTGKGSGPYNGMLSVYLDPNAIDDGHGFGSSVNDYIEYVRSCSPAIGVECVQIPGDPERRAKTERLELGIPLSEETYQNLVSAARERDVPSELIALAV